ncbi:MAG: DUF106 domain-containing protein [Haloarculaceae archaeon]
MAGTADRVRDLVDDDDQMAGVVQLVLDRAEDGAVTYGDVRDDVDSGRWGRLIDRGVLVEAGDEYVLRDPEGVREGLEEATKEESSGSLDIDMPDEPEGDSSWSIYDKAAAVGAVGLFAGYSIRSVRDVIGNTLDLLLGPLDAALPFYVVVMVLALFTGLYSTLLQANLMDMDKMAYYQDRMKALQNKRDEAKEAGDDEALDQLQKEQMEAMGENLGMFKEQFRPMVWIMLFTIPVFLWMYWMILADGTTITPETIVLPIFGEKTWTGGVLGPIQAWIVWYFLCSMGFTQIIRKALDIQTTPTGT